jgi:hypothetical protein
MEPSFSCIDASQRYMVVGVTEVTHSVVVIGYAYIEPDANFMRQLAEQRLFFVWTDIVDRWLPDTSPGVWGEPIYNIDEGGVIMPIIWEYYLAGHYAGAIGDYGVSWTAFPTGHELDHISHLHTKKDAIRIVEQNAVVGQA